MSVTRKTSRREKRRTTKDEERCTATRRPVRMVYAERHPSPASAIAREHQLKRWSRDKKEALIRDDRTALDRLSHRLPKPTIEFTWRDLLKRRS